MCSSFLVYIRTLSSIIEDVVETGSAKGYIRYTEREEGITTSRSTSHLSPRPVLMAIKPYLAAAWKNQA